MTDILNSITTLLSRYILTQLSLEEKNASMPAITKLTRSLSLTYP